MKKIVNALGDACPLPVVKATHALQAMQEAGILEVHVDNTTAVQNLLRMAAGHKLVAKDSKLSEKEYVVTMEVTAPQTTQVEAEPVVAKPTAGDNVVVAIASECLGHGSEELGKTLMKGFIFALSQLPKLPKTILFYNGGAKLTVEGSASLEDLKKMAEQGVTIMTCGTCLNYYKLTDKLAVGQVTNMYSIVETLAQADKVIKQ
jgi:selenium metabolism protein YedF